jgi:Zn-dependent metalloprotease
VRPHRGVLPAAALVVAAALALAVPAPALGQPTGGRDGWTRTLSIELSARDLDLRAGTPSRRLARAALARSARRLGLPRSLRGLRVARTRHVPRGPQGAAELDLVRFQQTVRGVRVLWSQIDVAVAAGEVSSIAATVVPVTGRRVRGVRRVSRKRALRIARRAVAGPERALPPLPVAHAGEPSIRRGARARGPRLAWVVETMPASQLDAETPTPLCIVIDAQTGRVIGRWRGIAHRPDRGPQARGSQDARAAQADAGSLLLFVRDGTGADADRSDPLEGTTAYAGFAVDGDPHRGANWPPFTDSSPFNRPCTEPFAPPPCVNYFGEQTDVMDAVATNARNVAFTVCAVRDFCGAAGGPVCGPGCYSPWQVIGNGTANRSRAFADTLAVEIQPGDQMDGTCNDPPPIGCPGGPGDPDPRQPFNDVIAHEFGHVRDWVSAGDRAIDDHDHRRAAMEARTVQEALADMFAYDYDRDDATLAEDAEGGATVDWQFPGTVTYSGQPQPDHMNDYAHPPPPKQKGGVVDEHFNATILSHAYFLFVQEVGHAKAGHVLRHVPAFLSPRPSFAEVASAFIGRARDLYGSEVGAAASTAFQQVGLVFDPDPDPEDPFCPPLC